MNRFQSRERSRTPRSRAAHLATWVMIAALVGNLIAAILPSSSPGVGTAWAAGSDLQAAQKALKDAKAELKALQARLDKLAQKQADAQDRLESTRDRIGDVQARAEKAEADLAKSQAQLEERLVAIYKNRGSDGLNALEAIFSADDMSLGAVMERMALVNHVAEKDAQLVAAVEDRLGELKNLRAELEEQKAQEQQVTVKYEAAREDTLQSLEDSKDTYNALRARVAQLEEEERIRKEEEARRIAAAKAAAERASAEKAAAEKAAADKAAADASKKGSTATTKAKTTTTTNGKTTATANKTTSTTKKPTTTTTKKKPAPVINVTGDWVFPVQGPNSFIDSFGAARSGGRSHQGTDIMTARNTPLVAVTNGVISSTSLTTSLGGVTIHLRGDDGNTYYYAHLSSIESGVKAGVRVKAGQVIGYAGNTGNASGGAVHLHFEIRPGGGSAINPYATLVKYR